MNSQVSEEVRALFEHIGAYTPRQTELTPTLKPFLIDMLPAVRDPDALLSVPRPDGVESGLGVRTLDEQCNRLLPVAGGTTLLTSPRAKQAKERDERKWAEREERKRRMELEEQAGATLAARSPHPKPPGGAQDEAGAE